MEQLLNADHGGHGGQRIACGGGHQAEFIDYRTKAPADDSRRGAGAPRLLPLRGVPGGRRAGVIPKDQELDVVGTSFSPGMRRLMARVGAQEPFDAARQDLAELAGVVVPTKAVERISEAVGAAAEARNQAERARVLAGQGRGGYPDRLYVAMDGTGVPAVPRETEGRAGKAADGKAKTREAKLGCVFTQTSFDAEGWPIRDPASTSYVGAIETVEDFGPRLHAEAARRGLAARTVIVLGDGAPGSGTWPRRTSPGRSHRRSLPRAGASGGGRPARLWQWHETAKAWVAARRDELDDGDVEAVIAAIRKLSVETISRCRTSCARRRNTSRPTSCACATSISGHGGSSSAPASSRLDAKR